MSRDWLILLLSTLLLGGLAWVVQGFWASLLTDVFLLAALAIAWNMLGGLAGYISLGSQAFYGFGAYALGISMAHYGWSLPSAMVLALAVGLVSGAAIGYPLLRIRGHYFILGTFATAAVLADLTPNIQGLGIEAGGAIDIPIPSLGTYEFDRFFYLLMLAVAVGAMATFLVISRTRIGLALRVIRSNETVADAVGVPTTRYKLAAFVISSAIFAVAGAARAYLASHIEPNQVFSLTLMIQVLVAVILGGLGSTWGPVLGSAFILLLTQATQSSGNLNVIVYAAIVILIALFWPSGMIAALQMGGQAARQALKRWIAYHPAGSEP